MKARFEGELDLRHLDVPVGKKWFMVLKPLVYVAESGMKYCIPRGIYTDFASIPKLFRSIISRVGRISKPAVLHDWLCSRKIVNRKEADKLLKEAMITQNVGWLKRRIAYRSVRIYSIATFKK
jgi:hypothetical protein